MFDCQPESRVSLFALRELREAITDRIDYHGERGDRIANDGGDPGADYLAAHAWEKHRDTFDQLRQEWEDIYDPE